MIDREDVKVIKNILSLNNDSPNVDVLYNILSAIKYNDSLLFLKSILPISQPDIDSELLLNIYSTIKEEPELTTTLLDSFSNNQLAAKTALINAINNLNILDRDSTVVIWGAWYGSVLIPTLVDKVKKIVNIDLDNVPLQIAKNRLFADYDNIEYICDDIFKTYRDTYLDTNLIINTSCEHMLPMKDWPWFRYSAMATDTVYPKGYADDKPHRKKVYGEPKLSSNCYFAFQSNNMFGIEGHVNCVNSLQEFKEQMPERAEVLFEEEVEDTRGTRYMLVGKFNPL